MKEDLFKELPFLVLNKNSIQTDLFMIRSVQGTRSGIFKYEQTNESQYFCMSVLYSGKALNGSETDKPFIKGPAVLLREQGEMQVHSLDADCEAISLYFSQDFLNNENLPWNSYLNQVFLNNVVPLTENELKDMHSYLALIIYEHQKNTAKARTVIANLLMILFKMIIEIRIEPSYAEGLPGSRLSYFRFKILIEQHFKSKYHVQAYADELCMTAEMLGKVVKDMVNKTPKQVIDERLIAEAKRMLAWTKISNKEIAYHLGFESDSYFNRYFKRHCHQTPSNYRQQLQSDKAVKHLLKGNLISC
jgi:AraC-like DNA-binding protein